MYPFDFKSFDDHVGNTGAYAVFEKLPDDTWLVVPCWEILRFYFGGSGTLAARLLSGPLEGKSLYTSVRHDSSKDLHWLDLAPGLHATAASTVARIALDATAASAARWIVNSGTAALANGDSYYPKTNFPFSGETDLTVQARVLQGAARVLFVERIIRCSHPFPFRQLNYSIVPRNVRPILAKQWTAKKKANTHEGRVSVVDGPVDPDRGVNVLHLPESSTSAFPDLDQKVFRRVRPRMMGRPTSDQSEKHSPEAVLADGSENAPEFPAVELAIEAPNELHTYPEVADVVLNAVEVLRREGLSIEARGLDGESTSVKLLAEVMSPSPEMAHLYGVIQLDLRGVPRGSALCVMRTDESAAQTETHLLVKRRKSKTLAQDLEAVASCLRDGYTEAFGQRSLGEMPARDPLIVARMIRSVLLTTK